ncbi:MAG: hypothetical protein ACRDKS_14695 [Actinomycetota bacterium]
MRVAVVVAFIAAFPPTLAAILSFLAGRRALRRAVGEPTNEPVITLLLRLEEKVDRLTDGQALVRERVARVESDRHRHAFGGSR